MAGLVGLISHPYRLIRVFPGEVEYLLVPRAHTKLARKGSWVLDGDWDRCFSDESLVYLGSNEGFRDFCLIDFENFVFFNSLVERFVGGVEWEDTEFYRKVVTLDISCSRYTSVDRINDQLERLDRLYFDIRDNGYKTQAELQMNGGGPFEPVSNRRFPELGEVIVNVGRDGEVLFNTGRHRFCIARVLGLEIPVRVFLRHKCWQDVRREVFLARDVDCLSDRAFKYLEHPDVRYLHDFFD
ncbi:ParB-like nuclease domain containing protein [Methanonatronarchaeum thermophilum]|uniref:ParB-like nuclease domain containing protein n=1 Tax=Methanonatronarchaeum thermophilum TaxID=1927129 RepID=A0A1Y3G9Z3_9EURY|nr:hypothetical protein [Methanonatronarchaeum thermophilum]OUJ18261.1 ParB-like nuclease domain containing protein [Methanonatronarchaeum thermophilum]